MVTETPKRRWCQFSLKTLLLVTAVIAAAVAFCFWVQFRRNQARENRERVATSEKAITTALSAISDARGGYLFERKELRSQTWLEKQFDDPGSPDDPVGVLKVRYVSFFVESGDPIGASPLFLDANDATLAPLKELTTLEHLDLRGTKITDAGLEHLKGLSNLKSLNLSDTNVTDHEVMWLQWALPDCYIYR